MQGVRPPPPPPPPSSRPTTGSSRYSAESPLLPTLGDRGLPSHHRTRSTAGAVWGVRGVRPLRDIWSSLSLRPVKSDCPLCCDQTQATTLTQTQTRLTLEDKESRSHHRLHPTAELVWAVPPVRDTWLSLREVNSDSPHCCDQTNAMIRIQTQPRFKAKLLLRKIIAI